MQRRTEKQFGAVRYIKDILQRYPEVTFISNVEIKGIKGAHYFHNTEELLKELKAIDLNSIKGYLIFIDEIHVVLAELFGKTDPIFLQFLSQQRKLSIHIIGTAQMFNYCPKFIRKYLIQSGQIILCKKYFKVIQIEKIIDMETIKEEDDSFYYERCKNTWYIHTKELYESYDTYAVISQIKGLMKGSLRYDNRLSNNNGDNTET